MSTRDEFADFTRSLLNDAAMTDRRVSEAMLGAALIDQAWGSRAAGNPIPSAPAPQAARSLETVARELAAMIGDRERELDARRAALSVFVARYMDAVSGVLDQFDQITVQLAQRLATQGSSTSGTARRSRGASTPSASHAYFPPDQELRWLPDSPPDRARPAAPWSPTGPRAADPIRDSPRTAPCGSEHRPDDTVLTPTEAVAPSMPDEVDLRGDYRRLAKLIAPDLGQRDDVVDQARRTELLARLSAAYRHGDAATMALIEVEVGAGPHPAEPANDAGEAAERRERLSRTCVALESRLERLDAEMAALDASTMDQLRRHAELAEAAGGNFLADHVAGMRHQTAQIQASLDELNGGAIRHARSQ